MEYSKYLTSSTGLPETSSGGLSPLGFTQPWSLRTWIEFGTTPPRAVFHATVMSAGEPAGEELSLWFESEGDEAVKRQLGCALMFAVPEEAVDEAVHSLADIFLYHDEQSHLLPPAKAVIRRTQGRVTGISVRPPVDIEE